MGSRSVLVVKSEEEKHDLEFFKSLEEDFLRDFCELSISSIKAGENNPKVFRKAAEKLDVDPSMIQYGVKSLSHLFTENAKADVNAARFEDNVLELGVPATVGKMLTECYEENKEAIRQSLEKFKMPLKSYKDLEWRLDIDIASRSLRSQVEPRFLLNLQTEDGDGAQQSELLQADYQSLRNVCSELETALAELKVTHTRRVTRFVK
eukprot:GFYU01004642.1.p1 GENE.GFYU01004642.1~~GFYU01004642.1.p1  ORF type:complete len:207 (-),score=41.24 GFYU01004642.1:31-651(-)